MIRQYSAYPAYEAPPAKWQECVPVGWNSLALGRMFRRVKRSGFPEEELLSVYRDYGVIPKSSRDDNFNKPSEDLSPYQLVRPGDLVMNKMKAWQGSIAMSEHRGIVSPAYFVYEAWRRNDDRLNSKYIHYLLRSPAYIAQYLSRSKGIRVNQWDLDPGAFERIEVLLPSREEQTQIAKFLEFETAKINAMIEKQKQLIALLKEKRQAVISHAVTKGLNPNSPMRDSGVEWLGEIPAHWDVLPFRHALLVSNGQVDPRIPPYCTMPLIAPNHIEPGTGRLLALESAKEQGAVSGKYEVREGDVIYSKIRPALRKVTVAPEACLCSADMYALHPTRGGDPAFFSWLLLSEYFSGIVVLESMRVAMPKVNRETLAPIPLPVPGPSEQQAIADHLSTQTARLDTLMDKGRVSTGLLQERRIALISAAVTGKVDVRDWKAPESEPDAEVA